MHDEDVTGGQIGEQIFGAAADAGDAGAGQPFCKILWQRPAQIAATDFDFGETLPVHGLVEDVFHSVAPRYDLMNDLMSFGLHRAWKDALVTAVNPPKNHPFALIDIAGGTGDVAFRVVGGGGAQTRATGCDINTDMLEVGRER